MSYPQNYTYDGATSTVRPSATQNAMLGADRPVDPIGSLTSELQSAILRADHAADRVHGIADRLFGGAPCASTANFGEDTLYCVGRATEALSTALARLEDALNRF